MRIAPLADVKARLSAYMEQCETDGPVIITRKGLSRKDFWQAVAERNKNKRKTDR